MKRYEDQMRDARRDELNQEIIAFVNENDSQYALDMLRRLVLDLAVDDPWDVRYVAQTLKKYS